MLFRLLHLHVFLPSFKTLANEYLFPFCSWIEDLLIWLKGSERSNTSETDQNIWVSYLFIFHFFTNSIKKRNFFIQFYKMEVWQFEGNGCVRKNEELWNHHEFEHKICICNHFYVCCTSKFSFHLLFRFERNKWSPLHPWSELPRREIEPLWMALLRYYLQTNYSCLFTKKLVIVLFGFFNYVISFSVNNCFAIQWQSSFGASPIFFSIFQFTAKLVFVTIFILNSMKFSLRIDNCSKALKRFEQIWNR